MTLQSAAGRIALEWLFSETFPLHTQFVEQPQPLRKWELGKWHDCAAYSWWAKDVRRCLLAGIVPPEQRMFVRLQLQRAGRLCELQRSVDMRDVLRLSAELEQPIRPHSWFLGPIHRLDFLLRMDWGLCALEVDEGAHCLREQAEEAERMLKVRARHPKLRFVRYNPDCFGVGGQLAEVPQSERHARLLRAVREPPRQDFEVVYLCYDQAQPDSPLPQVCEDPGFPEELKPYVRTDTGSGAEPPP